MGLTLLIPLGLGFVIRVNGLFRLPFMDHGEVFYGFLQGLNLEKKRF